MGFLDHSTNNIIVDAVLTNYGRRALSKNDGSFTIAHFCLADDEVDYGIIEQFGRTVGKEKIEKNTPVLEALTNESVAIKHKLLSVSNPMLTHMPVITVISKTGSTSGQSEAISLSRSEGKTVHTVQLEIKNTNATQIENDLIDGSFIVTVNNLFLQVSGRAPQIVRSNNSAVYEISQDADRLSGNAGEYIMTFPIQLKNFRNSIFDTYSVSTGSHIRTFIKVTGVNSGIKKILEVKISK